jgi:putative photosynthetic complex assembly protein 2
MDLTALLQPFAFVTFIWWFATGLILLLDKRAVSIRFSVVFAGLFALGSLYCLTHLTLITTTRAVYASFFCAILIWAWVEVSFLSGFITGPTKTALPAGSSKSTRLLSALNAVLYHEVAIAITGLLVYWVCYDKPNQAAWWTFLVLWVMRTSAKLNLFLGVRNLGLEYLPKRLTYLGSFFRERRMNWLFPFSVIGSTVAAALMISHALKSSTTSATATGVLLAASLLMLAMLEHWLMVIPVKSTALWRWATRHQTPANVASATPLDKS